MADRIKIADLVAETRLDNDRFIKELRDLSRAVDRRTDGMVNEFRKVERRGSSIFRRLGSSVRGAFVGIGAFFAARGIFRGFQKMIGLASDTTESMNKVKEVFGESAAAVIAFSDKAATSLGATRQEALAMTGEIGNLLVAMGANGDEAAGMSTRITQLAADLGSFNNVPTVEALNAIRSALVGETEPIRRFGSDVRVARLEQIALAKGIDKSRLATDAYLKSQIALEAIFQDTQKAQGDFNRTANDWANLQKTISSLVSDAAAKLGTALIPKLTEFARIVKEFLTGDRFDVFIDNLSTRFDSLATAVSKVVGLFVRWVNSANAERIQEIQEEIGRLQGRIDNLQSPLNKFFDIFGDKTKQIEETKVKIAKLNDELLSMVKITESDLPVAGKASIGGEGESSGEVIPVDVDKLDMAREKLKQLGTDIDKIASRPVDSEGVLGRLQKLEYVDVIDPIGEGLDDANQKTKQFEEGMRRVAFEAGNVVRELLSGRFTLGGLLSLFALIPGPQQAFVSAAAVGANSAGFKHGGGGIVHGGNIAKAQFGLSGIVPSGFNNDDFLVGVSTRERVNVETPFQASLNDKTLRNILQAQQATNANISRLSQRQDNVEASVNVEGRDLHLIIKKQQQREARFF